MPKLLTLPGLLIVAGLLASCAGPAAAPTPTKAPAAPAPPKAEAPPATPTKAPAAPKKQYLMGSTATASSLYAYFVGVAKVINAKVPEVNVTQVESGAAVDNVNRMGKDEFHLGLGTTDVVYRAMQGLGPWKDKPIPVIRVLWSYIVNPMPYIVREDSGVTKLEELDGKDFNPGLRGSATESQTKAILETLGIKPKWYIGGTEDALAAVKDRRIVGWVKGQAGTRFPDATVLDLAAFTRIRIFPFTPEQKEKVVKEHPYYSFTEIPAGTYKFDWNKEPILTPALINVFMAHTEVPEDIAYKITKVIIEDNKPSGEGVQATTFPGVKGEDFVQLTLQYASTPLHSGAYKYYKELGLAVPDKIVPPEIKR